MILEDGKRYVDVNGTRHRATRHPGTNVFYVPDPYTIWRPNGTSAMGGPDLVAEYVDPEPVQEPAKTFGEMTRAEKGELLLWEHEGGVVQRLMDGDWGWDLSAIAPTWDDDAIYRKKPTNALIHGTMEADDDGNPIDGTFKETEQ